MSLKPLVITGHPYAFPYYFKVFEYAEGRGNLIFALPKLWLAKKGKVKIKLEQKPEFRIYGLRPISYGGHGMAGLFKGWLPGLIFLLPYLKIKYKSKVLYSCSEPYLFTTLLNGLVAKLCGMKYVFFTWQNVEPKTYLSGLKLKIYISLIKFNLYLADGVICGNKKAAEIIKGFRVQGSGFRVIVCPLAGVDTEKFRPGIKSNWREKLGVKSEEKLILFYGALDKRKGLNVLIDAFDRICKLKTVNCKLLLVGTGPKQESLKLKTKNYKLETKVTFLDWMPNDELPGLLNASDVFVYPSVPSKGWEEQFGYAMAEASACGVPVVATKTGSIDEVIVDNQSGILVEPNNPDELADAMGKILSDNQLAKQMGNFGREYVVTNFNHSVIAGKMLNFLRSFLS